MRFKERFQGKVSNINKQGLLGQVEAKELPIAKSSGHIQKASKYAPELVMLDRILIIISIMAS